MTILIFIDWYKPAYKAGGPVQSISNLVSRFSDDVNFKIITSDRDLGDKVAFKDVELNTWVNQADSEVIYLSPDNQNKARYKELIKDIQPDVVYINSIFSKNFAIVPLLLCTALKVRTVLAPRGMLGAGALAQGKLKKSVFLQLFKIKGIHKKVEWHATAPEEEVEIKTIFGRNVRVKIASNFPAMNLNRNEGRQKEVRKVSLFFMSRISPKKNLLFALEVLKSVKSDVDFDIIGPVDDGDYWEKCQELIKELPTNVKVNYVGSILHEEIGAHLKDYHFFFLPTRNENFGHVIVEAMSNACPVIISDQTPWKSLATNKVGWDIPLNDKEKFIEVVESTASMNQEEYNAWAEKTYHFASQVLNDENVLRDNKSLFGLD